MIIYTELCGKFQIPVIHNIDNSKIVPCSDQFVSKKNNNKKTTNLLKISGSIYYLEKALHLNSHSSQILNKLRKYSAWCYPWTQTFMSQSPEL